MLAPDERLLYADALRPPVGFRLDFAVGTTFSLDLSALLAVPLAFALHEWKEGEAALLDDPIAALDAVRRCANRIAIFCQAGRIAAPTRNHPLFTFLEGSIVESRVSGEKAGEFHAKTWLLRFVGHESEVRYRFVCLSRNLTLDQSWDTVLRFEGPLMKDRGNGYGRNVPLQDYLNALPGFALRTVRPELKTEIDRMAEEIRKVDFAVPEPFEDFELYPIGIEGYRGPKISKDGTRIMVVSPFLAAGQLEKLGCGEEDVLVSRVNEINAIGQVGLGTFKHVFTLDEQAEPEVEPGAMEEDEDSDRTTRRGLHAKLYVVDEGWKASVWSGSANATNAGFNTNLEFLVRMTGKKKDVGVDAFREGRDGGLAFGGLLHPYDVPPEAVAPDPDALAAEKRVEEIRRVLSSAALELQAAPDPAASTWCLTLSMKGAVDFANASVRCKPVTLPAADLKDASGLGRDTLSFAGLPLHYLTSLISFEVVSGTGKAKQTARFVLNLPLSGAPAERHQAALQAVIGSPERLLRYLLLLLSNDEDLPGDGLASLLLEGNPAAGATGSGIEGMPLMEELLRTLARAPARLDAVQRLVDDLRKTPEGTALLPQGFDSLWRAIWKARGEKAA